MSREESSVESTIREIAGAMEGLDEAGLVEVFQALLTPQERRKIALRWQLVCLLEAGLSQRAVAARLGVSLCKITRGSHELKYGPGSFRRMIRDVVRRSGSLKG